MFSIYLLIEYRQPARPLYGPVVLRLAGTAKTTGVSLNLEVVNRFESNRLNTTAQGLAYIRDAGVDNIFLHLDTEGIHRDALRGGQAPGGGFAYALGGAGSAAFDQARRNDDADFAG